ncbi:unnamed protein product, partial [marine sediment metagenome]
RIIRVPVAEWEYLFGSPGSTCSESWGSRILLFGPGGELLDAVDIGQVNAFDCDGASYHIDKWWLFGSPPDTENNDDINGWLCAYDGDPENETYTGHSGDYGSPSWVPHLNESPTFDYCYGACCIGETCTIETEEDCSTVGIYKGGGTDCGPPNPCLQEGDKCTLPIVVTLPAELDYTNSNGTCGRGDNYHATCLGDYDGGEDIIYEIDVTEDLDCIDIEVVTGSPSYVGVAIDDECPLAGSGCIETATSAGSDVSILDLQLTAGTYY